MQSADTIIAIDARLACAEFTGDSTYWTGLLHGLAQSRSDFRFHLYSNAPRPEGIPSSREFQWITLPSRSGRWWSLVRFPLEARRRGASVIHTQYNLSPLAGTVGITTVHDVSFLIEPRWFRPVDRALLRRFVPASIRRAKRVITVSEASKADIAKHVPTAGPKLRVTPLAPHLGIERLEPEEAARIVSGELDVQRPYLLTVGTRWPRKNQMLAIEAANALGADLPHALIVTGKAGWGEERVDGRCRAVGYVTDRRLSALYSCADLFLAPSLYEGFGLTVLEAMACGCPVLCSGIAAHKEVASDAAAVMRSWEPKDWASEIRSLLADSSKLARLTERGLARARGFSWQKTAAATLGVYEEVIRIP